MKRVTWVIFLAVMFFLNGYLIAGAHTGWNDESPYMAKIRCATMAEDTASHLRLVEYDPGANGLRLIYRCVPHE